VSRLPYVDPRDPNLDPAIRDRMLRPGADGERVVNVIRALANDSQALRALGELSRVGDSVTRTQRELAYLTTSVLNNCFY
jgi:hypothetical protein